MTVEQEETDLVQSEAHEANLSAGAANNQDTRVPPRTKRSFARWIILLAVMLIAAGSTLWWLHTQGYESTDDAQIEGHLDLVSARISGTVIAIHPKVENNQFVEAGTLLME